MSLVMSFKAAAYLVGVIAIGALWFQWHIAAEQRDSARAARDQAWRDAAQRQMTIDALQGQVARLSAQQVENGKRQAALERLASIRQVKLQEWGRDHEDVKRWADGALPADVVRMQQRPAVTGTAGYLDAVRGADTVHATGSQPGD